MPDVRYLTESQILLIHSFVIESTGGLHGVRDHGAIQSTVMQPRQIVFGKTLYPTPYDKAAVYARTIILNHPFLDGNKRSGMTAAFVFLEDNGYRATAEKGEIELFALRIANENLDIPSIADWFETHSRRLQ